MGALSVLTYFLILLTFIYAERTELDLKLTKVWGPGLTPDKIIMPARYFFIEARDKNNKSFENSLEEKFEIKFDGKTSTNNLCRLWTNLLDRKDGSYIVRYKVYETCYNMKIIIKYKSQHVAESPYSIRNDVYPDDCVCCLENIKEMMDLWSCSELPFKALEQFKIFQEIDWEVLRDKVIEKFHQPLSISLCHYVLKENRIYRKCYGKYVGFNMFMDSILKSLTRKVHLPDMEFFVNLGDWPLSSHDFPEKYPILSWCGSTKSYDIIMPTYDITESSLENMGRVMLDMLSVQGNVKEKVENRIPKMFWRGRDSNRNRLYLKTLSQEHPDLFNVSLTNFFFYRDEEPKYGPKSEHVSFFTFFDYKYQIAIDGTVSAYRLPYLLGGGSLLFKQDSMYYEHFYNELVPNVHYIPVKKDLSNLMDKLNWATNNEKKAVEIAKNGQKFANDKLLPKNIFCYYVALFREFSSRIVSEVRVLEGMEEVEQTKIQDCNCRRNTNTKDEL